MVEVAQKTIVAERDLSRREFGKAAVGILASLVGLGLTIEGWQDEVPSVLDKMSVAHVENSLRQALHQRIAVPPDWGKAVSGKEVVNTHYMNPGQILEKAYSHSTVQPYFDADFPMLITPGMQEQFWHDIRQRSRDLRKDDADTVEHALGNIIFKVVQPSLENTEFEKRIFYMDQFFGNPQVAGFFDLITMLGDMKYHNISRTVYDASIASFGADQLAQFEQANRDMHQGVPTTIPAEQGEDMARLFAKNLWNQIARIRQEIDAQRGGKQISTAEFVRYFTDRNDGATLRGLADAHFVSRAMARSGFNPDTGYIEVVNPLSYSDDSRWLGTAIRDDISLILPWNSLVDNAQFVISAQKVLAANRNDEGDTSIQDWYYPNRIGALPHYLSLAIMSGCLPNVLMAPLIYYKYYGFADMREESDMVRGFEEIQWNEYLQMLSSTPNGMSNFLDNMGYKHEHGRVKIATDIMAVQSGKRVRHAIRRPNSWI